MGKVISVKLEDTRDGCVLTAYHKPGQKRRAKWVLNFDHRDPVIIKAEVAAKEPRVPHKRMAILLAEEVKEEEDDRRRG